jgi:D-lactate dehydrogenase
MGRAKSRFLWNGGIVSSKKGNSDYHNLSDSYRKFYDEAAVFIPEPRRFCDPYRTLAYGTDASFYRLIPKIVIKVETPEEVSNILGIANRLKIPVTFRAAGTSLSGQAVTDSVLLLLAGAWQNYSIHDNGERITLEPGVIGAHANIYLSQYSRKIGPDPASIDSCMIGGIAANNASGMCCGTAQNSYRTVEGMKIILYDGTVLDTRDPKSKQSFAESHKALIKEIEGIRDEISSDATLNRRIREKYRIKNTTGYSLNAFVDYSDPVDIILHLMIGSEGTLAFNAEITYKTVVEHTHKASALIFFPDIENACKATIILKKEPVSAVELMDRASIRSVENKEGLPSYLRSLGEDVAALLVEIRAGDPASLAQQVAVIKRSLASIPTVFPISFTDIKQEFENLWKVRKGLFPAVGGARKIGTTVIIEDVAFPIEKLADATVELQRLMRHHGYDEGIIFGHALEGNLHFVFTQDFSFAEEVLRYQRFMEEVTTMVVKKYDGSLKGEHGTGRNMAPFVELEWGEKAYSLMKRIKKAFDPDNLLNPGVIMNDNPSVYLENLKPMPKTHEIVDKCIECGFCEVKCPSRNLTTTPRQRIVTQREIARLRASQENGERLKRLERFNGDYVYLGEQTCAADGLCATACPVSINTGDLTKYLRSLNKSTLSVAVAQWTANHYSTISSGVRASLSAVNMAHSLIGTSLMGRISRGMRTLLRNKIPQWNPYMPKGLSALRFRDIARGSDLKVVYFPSCVVRTMGPAKGDKEQRLVFDAMLSVLEKAGYDVHFPKNMENLCCGITYESKGFFEQADQKSRELEEELFLSSRAGKYPILCDTSPCLYRMRRKLNSGLKLYEPVEFIHDFLRDHLEFKKIPETIAVHVTCSSTKMSLNEKFKTVAQACAEKVVIPMKVGCCGFAGDRGFTYPELNESALSELKPSLPPDCKSGYSNSRTCEIGLSLHGGIDYQSIVYLVDRCTEKKPKPKELPVPEIPEII